MLTIIAPLVFIVSFTSTAYSVSELKRETLPDTRWIATQWILENFTDTVKIAREAYTPPVEEYSKKYLVVRLLYRGRIALPENHDVVSKQHYAFLSSYAYSRFVDYPEKYPEMAKRYTKFFNNHELVIEFVPDWEKNGGPVIRIYKINPQASVHQNN